MKTVSGRVAEIRGREGFTLIEVLVVVALLAALVAIVAPQLFNQLDKGDATQVSSDLESVSSAVKAFRVDVSPRFPGDIEDLVFEISTNTNEDNSLDGSSYNEGQQQRWNGSYLEINMDPTATTSGATAFETGFGGEVQNGLATGTPTNGSGTWVTIDVTGLATSDCEVIDQQVDDNDLSTGRYECSGGTLTFFAVQQ